MLNFITISAIIEPFCERRGIIVDGKRILIQMKKFFSGATVFALIGIAAKAIGAFYRIPLTAVLKSEGIGVYQTVFPLYALVLTAASGGLPCAISTFVSLNRRSAHKALTLSVISVSAISTLILLVVFVFSKQIASLQGNPDASAAYKFITPAVLFAGVIACFRGYFQGYQNMLPSGISQLIEQIVKAAVGVALAKAWISRGVIYGVCGAVAGVTISEIAATLFLIITYLFGRKKHTLDIIDDVVEFGEDVAEKNNREILRGIYSTALPVTLNSLALPLTLAADSFVIINVLGKQATSLYGVWSGPVGSIVNVPSVISVAVAAAVLPEAARGAKDFRTDKILATLLPVFFVLLFSARPILATLYPSLNSEEGEIAAKLLGICAINVPLSGLISVSSAYLQANGRAKIPLLNLAIGCVLKITVSLVLLPRIGIFGAAIGSVVCYAVAAVLDMAAALKCGGVLCKKTLVVIVCSIVFGLVYLPLSSLRTVKSALLAGLAASTVYFLLLLKTKCIKIKQITL